jgi:hypothetical protein
MFYLEMEVHGGEGIRDSLPLSRLQNRNLTVQKAQIALALAHALAYVLVV